MIMRVKKTKLKKASNSKAWKLNLELVHIVKASPQRYHLFEVVFSTIRGRSRVMKRNAKFSLKIRYKVC